MNRKTLVTAVTIGALGSAGIALAEGTSTEKKQTQKQTQEQPELQQGQTSSETAATAPQQEQQNVQKKGVARLDSVRISSLDESQIKTLQGSCGRATPSCRSWNQPISPSMPPAMRAWQS